MATAAVPAAAAPLVDHAPPVSDPVAEAIAAAESAFEAGRAASDQGHLRDARLAFDLALDTLFAMPGGARADERLSAAVDTLVDRIAAIELATLSRGDGFTETTEPEPASIDALLSLPAAEADAAPAPEVATTVRADLAATAHDIPIPQNDRVLRFVELFQGNLRGFLTEGMIRGAAYLPMIHTVFRQEGLPLDLSYVPLVESAFKTSALSRASARGVWQFMRGTGKENGLTHDWYVDERADPEKATRAAARYLKTLYTMFGDWHLALASYNGGPGRVQRAIKRSGISDFWTLTATSRYLPRETRDYVPMILAAAIIAKNPAQYGFDRPAAPPFTSDVLTVARPVDLRRVAEWAGVPADDIRALNPELRRWTTPIRAREYQLRVPLGTLHSVLDGYAAAGPDDTAVLQWYTVKKGESLPTIARRLRVARNDLAEANYLSGRARLVPGQRLVVPRAPSPALLASRGAQGADRAADDAGVPARTIYRVRKGDTLYAIARRHGVSVENLRAWNGLKGSALAIGARLEIHSPRQSTAQ
ncbi:MAG: LysM peptidoglycan-binding domain-containing protein [Vicinamibacterales bacterium]